MWQLKLKTSSITSEETATEQPQINLVYWVMLMLCLKKDQNGRKLKVYTMLFVYVTINTFFSIFVPHSTTSTFLNFVVQSFLTFNYQNFLNRWKEWRQWNSSSGENRFFFKITTEQELKLRQWFLQTFTLRYSFTSLFFYFLRQVSVVLTLLCRMSLYFIS